MKKIIAPIFKVLDLRECNVLFHSGITQKREVCPGLPVVYLVEPTEENIKMIASDCQKNLYDFVFVNFTSQLTDSALDKFAIEMTRVKSVHKICKVGYEHLGSFQVVSDDFFTLFSRPSNFIDLYQNRNEDEIVNSIS